MTGPLPRFLFVYGTLMEGQRNHALSHLGASFVARGAIRAKLYDLGEYPGAKPDHRHQVKGELYRLAKPVQDLALLDDCEDFVALRRHSSLFVRERVEVTLADRRTEIAWTYFYNRPIDESHLIAGGDYREFLRLHRGSHAAQVTDRAGQRHVECARKEGGYDI